MGHPSDQAVVQCVALVSCVVMLATVAAGMPAFAATGGIRVQVLDATSRQPLVGATVELSNENRWIAATGLVTNPAGFAAFAVLPTGPDYTVEVSMPGYATRRETGIVVAGGETREIVVILGTSREERISVTGRIAVVDLEQVGSSTKFSAEFIESLPQRGRQYQNVLPLAPGVNDQDEDGNPNVHGSRSRDFRAEVGGVSNVDPLTGQWLAYVNQDSIEELEVLPSGAGVEFGRAQGGFARIVQRQGTNHFEGTFSLLYRSSKLDGDGAATNPVFPPAEFETLQPALVISGPIVRDKLWYRLSQEWVRQEDPVNVLNRIVVAELEQSISANQLTWQVSPRHKLAFQLQYDPLEVTNLGADSGTPEESTQTFERGGETWSLNWVAPLSSRVLVDSLVAWQDHSHDLKPTAPDAFQTCALFFGIEQWNQSRCVDTGNNRVSGPHNQTSLDDRQRLSVQSQATWHLDAGRQSHQLKLGFRSENERYRRDLELAPEFNFEIVRPPLGDPSAVVSTRVYLPRIADAEATGNNWALYVEDRWKPSNGLSVTAGLRYDREEIDAPAVQPFDVQAEAAAFLAGLAAGRPASLLLRTAFTKHEDVAELRRLLAEALGISTSRVEISSTLAQTGFWERKRRQDDIHLVNGNLSPRINVAWDPWVDGKTKVFATAGRYHDKIFLAVPLFEVEPLESRETFQATVPIITPIPGDPFVAARQTAVLSPPVARAVDRDLDTPYQDEYSLGIEREIFTETAVRLTYLRRKYRDQLQDIEINHLPGDHGRCDRSQVGFPSPTQPAVYQGFVVTSPGSGQTVIDPFTGETWVDTDPGPGDGVIDDCIGDVTQATGFFPTAPGFDVPDGKPDLYVQNPAWEELLFLGNFNEADYRAFVLEVVRRLYRRWQLEGSYTWSEAEGDAEDFDLLLGNEQNQREDEQGYLDYDQRHVAKLNTITYAPGGWNLGLSATWQSGTPYSLLISQTTGFSTPPSYPFARTSASRPRLRYPTGQRNDQRNDSFWNFDMRIAKEFRISDESVLGFSFEAFNLLDDDTLDVENITGGEVVATRRFGRRYQLGLRLTF